jgi:hypothetical protein
MGQADSLKLKGRTKAYRATRGGGERHFCPQCGSALWVWDKRWAQWIYPFASAIDTKLPLPREKQYIFLSSKANWSQVPKGGKRFRAYPKEGILDWHRKRRLVAA